MHCLAHQCIVYFQLLTVFIFAFRPQSTNKVITATVDDHDEDGLVDGNGQSVSTD